MTSSASDRSARNSAGSSEELLQSNEAPASLLLLHGYRDVHELRRTKAQKAICIVRLPTGPLARFPLCAEGRVTFPAATRVQLLPRERGASRASIVDCMKAARVYNNASASPRPRRAPTPRISLVLTYWCRMFHVLPLMALLCTSPVRAVASENSDETPAERVGMSATALAEVDRLIAEAIAQGVTPGAAPLAVTASWSGCVVTVTWIGRVIPRSHPPRCTTFRP